MKNKLINILNTAYRISRLMIFNWTDAIYLTAMMLGGFLINISFFASPFSNYGISYIIILLFYLFFKLGRDWDYIRKGCPQLF